MFNLFFFNFSVHATKILFLVSSPAFTLVISLQYKYANIVMLLRFPVLFVYLVNMPTISYLFFSLFFAEFLATLHFFIIYPFHGNYWREDCTSCLLALSEPILSLHRIPVNLLRTEGPSNSQHLRRLISCVIIMVLYFASYLLTLPDTSVDMFSFFIFSWWDFCWYSRSQMILLFILSYISCGTIN